MSGDGAVARTGDPARAARGAKEAAFCCVDGTALFDRHGLVAAAGFCKLEQRIDEWGIFGVSLAERRPA